MIEDAGPKLAVVVDQELIAKAKQIAELSIGMDSLDFITSCVMVLAFVIDNTVDEEDHKTIAGEIGQNILETIKQTKQTKRTTQ